jgi:hypothetical protein
MSNHINCSDYSGPERRSSNGNGVKKLMLWIMGALLSVLLLGGSAWATWVSNQFYGINKELNLRQTRITSNEKMADIVVDMVKQNIVRMDRIENKIDRLIENLN